MNSATHFSATNCYKRLVLCHKKYEQSIYSFSLYQIRVGEIHGAYQIKVTTSALALLLSTRHAELAKVNVQGNLIKVLFLFLLFF